eukprot:2431341-Alexandrium_andersonii.AAC.1
MRRGRTRVLPRRLDVRGSGVLEWRGLPARARVHTWEGVLVALRGVARRTDASVLTDCGNAERMDAGADNVLV